MNMPVYLNYFLLAVLLILGSAAYAGWSAAPWVPAKRQDRKDILDALGISHGVKFYDLGCGDGWLGREAARLGARVVGYEISLPLFFVSWFKSLSVSGSLKILCRSFWKADLSDADVVFVFLMPKAMDRLRLKLEKECKPGARLVSYAFPVPGWEPKRIIQNPRSHKIYVYTTPSKTADNN